MSDDSTLGTTTISIKKDGSNDPVSAFLTISESSSRHQQQRDVQEVRLAVWILQDNNNTMSCWQGSAHLEEWKFLKSSGDSEHIDNIKRTGVSLLLSPDEHDKLDTLWTLSADDKEIKVTARDSRKGIKLTPWKATLQKQLESAKTSFQALKSVHAEMAATKETLAKQQKQSHAEQVELKQAADDYQHTVQALEGAWEREKTELLSNFLKLYNARVDVLQKQNSQLVQLREQLEQAETAAASKSSKAAAKPKVPDFLNDVPEDEMDIDEAMADRLEKGLPVPDKPVLAKRTAPTSKVRRNQVTGVTEYMDSDAALDHAFGDENEDKKPIQKKQPANKGKAIKKEPAPRKKRQTSGTDGDIKQEPKSSPVKATEKPIKKEPGGESILSTPTPAKKMRRRVDSSSSDTDSSGPVVRRRNKPSASPSSPISAKARRRTRPPSSSSNTDSDDHGKSDRRKATPKKSLAKEQTLSRAVRRTNSTSSDSDADPRRRTKPPPQDADDKDDSSATDDEADLMSR